MIGGGIFKYFSSLSDIELVGAARSDSCIYNLHLNNPNNKIYTKVNVENLDNLSNLIEDIKPDVVINGVGIVKQIPSSANLQLLIRLNALFPHELLRICNNQGARLIHISTDCVFSGIKGNYVESDLTDALDNYGKTKALGEIIDGGLTIRTSTIGHELGSHYGLLEWFLSQKSVVNGYSKAIFSGVTTIELAKIIYKFLLFDDSLVGLYNLSSTPIDKFELLNKINKVYGVELNINEDIGLIVDRSLNSDKFRVMTGYVPPSWDEMLIEMRNFQIKIK